MDAKTLAVTVNVVALLLLATGFSFGVTKTGVLNRGFQAQTVVGISGEIYCAELHTSSAQVRGGLSPFFKKKLMIARMHLNRSISILSQRPPLALMTSKYHSRIS